MARYMQDVTIRSSPRKLSSLREGTFSPPHTASMLSPGCLMRLALRTSYSAQSGRPGAGAREGRRCVCVSLALPNPRPCSMPRFLPGTLPPPPWVFNSGCARHPIQAHSLSLQIGCTSWHQQFAANSALHCLHIRHDTTLLGYIRATGVCAAHNIRITPMKAAALPACRSLAGRRPTTTSTTRL